jgi:alpha-1,2-glucosyltransferase
LNAVLALVCIQLAYALSTELQQQALQQNSSRTASKSSSKPSQQQQKQQELDVQRRAAGVALVVGLLPTQLFFAFMFYTDVASLLFLLLTELLLVRGATYAAAAAGAAAIGMRQTNAVWVTFLTGAAMLQYLLQQRQHQRQHQHPSAKDSGGSNGSSSVSSTKQQGASEQQQNPAAELFSLLGCAWQHKGALLARFWLLLLLPSAFCVFVVWNGSITLGDKEAHAPSAHLMQPLYFGVFLLSNAALLLLQPSITGPLLAGIKGRPLVWVLGLLAAAAGGLYIAARYSLAHPYLLADNRHYTFYIWRKVTSLLHRPEPWMRAGRVVSCLCMHTSL